MFQDTRSSSFSAKKKKKTLQSMESYYKILGTTANALGDKIKERYIEKVKAFPPETHPEEFQRIRMAYETLKNPKKRKDYDFAQKYGGKIEKILDKGNSYLEKGQMNKALICFEDALKIEPSSTPVLMTLGYISYALEKASDFNMYFDKAYEAAPQEYKISVLANKTSILMDGEDYNKALMVLEDIKIQEPTKTNDYYVLFKNVYLELEMQEKLWKMVQDNIDSLPYNNQNHEDIIYYANWVDAMACVGKWNLKSKVLSHTKKFIKGLKLTEEEKELLLDAIRYEYEGHLGAGNYKVAAIFIELLRILQPGDTELKHEFSMLQKKLGLQAEIDMIHRDCELFPLVYMEAMEMYLQENCYEAFLEFSDSVPPEIYDEFGLDDEGFAEGLARLKKRYKLVYLEYKDDWDAMFAEKISGLNREARRRIKY